MGEFEPTGENLHGYMPTVTDGQETAVKVITHAIRYRTAEGVIDIRLDLPLHKFAKFLIDNPDEPFYAKEFESAGFDTEEYKIYDRYDDLRAALADTGLMGHFIKTKNSYGFITNDKDPDKYVEAGLKKAVKGVSNPFRQKARSRPYLKLRDIAEDQGEEQPSGKRKKVAAAVSVLVFGGGVFYAWYSHQSGKLEYERKK